VIYYASALFSDCSDLSEVDDVPTLLQPMAEVRILTPLEEICRLQRKVDRMQCICRQRRLAWRRQKSDLLRRNSILAKKAATLDQLLEAGVLSAEQVRQAATGRRTCWGAKAVARALGLRCISKKAFAYVSNVLNLPLPSMTTLSRWIRSFTVPPGVMEAAAAVLEAAVQTMEPIQRLCVISFDEMSLDSRRCYDAAADQLLAASKLQV